MDAYTSTFDVVVISSSFESFLLEAPVTGISVASGVTKVKAKGCLNVIAVSLLPILTGADRENVYVPEGDSILEVTVTPVSTVPKKSLSPTATSLKLLLIPAAVKVVPVPVAVEVNELAVIAVVVDLVKLLSPSKKVTAAPAGTVMALDNVTAPAILLYPVEVTVVPESMPLIKTFLKATDTADPALLGAAFKDKVALLVFVVVLNAEAFGAVFTRRTESLCKVTRDVPNELAEDDVPGV